MCSPSNPVGRPNTVALVAALSCGVATGLLPAAAYAQSADARSAARATTHDDSAAPDGAVVAGAVGGALLGNLPALVMLDSNYASGCFDGCTGGLDGGYNAEALVSLASAALVTPFAAAAGAWMLGDAAGGDGRFLRTWLTSSGVGLLTTLLSFAGLGLGWSPEAIYFIGAAGPAVGAAAGYLASDSDRDAEASPAATTRATASTPSFGLSVRPGGAGATVAITF